MPSIGIGQGMANGFSKRRGGSQGQKLEPQAESSAVGDRRLQTGLASAVQELAGGEISGLGEHSLLFLEHSRRIELVHAEHELLFAFEIEVSRTPGQAGGIGD